MKKTLVIGLGLSGRAVSLFLLSLGKKVLGIDDNLNKLALNPEFIDLKNQGLIALDFQEVDFEDIELVIVSPGISPSHPAYKKALELGIPLKGETDFSLSYLKNRCLGITGTNGKTTVTLLTEHVLNACKIKAKAVGNVGTPLSTYLLQADPSEVLVIELSSYQLETMSDPIFDAGVILNITPDHLDRYPSMHEYAEAKCRLKKCIKHAGRLYLYEEVEKEYKDLLGEASYEVYSLNETSFLFNEKKPFFELLNAYASFCLCKGLGVSEEAFLEGLNSFKKPLHRVEFVKELNGVAFYDDSKGTNIDAVIKAVEAMPGPVILIGGGVDKGASYMPWKKPFLGKVKKIVVIGEAADKIENELSAYFDVEKEKTLEAAIDRALALANKGDCVLLSPGCSSFDMFRDYAHRGDVFKQYINVLEGRANKL